MFRRKDEAYDPNDLLSEVMSDPSDDQAVESNTQASSSEASENKPKPQSAPQASASAPAAAAAKASNENNATASQPAPAAAATATQASKPMPASAFRPQPAPAAAPAPAARSAASVPSAPETRSNTPVTANPKASKRVLTVGHDIHMKGEISTCDRLMIEGSVDATLKDVHTVELTQSGSFSGTAEIEDAEISGKFEGDLIVNGRLTIYSTGQVSGNVAYGEIEIERGGQLTGSIKTADQIKAEQQQPNKLKKAA